LITSHPPIILLNNRDFNVGQNTLDYDFWHNQAALLPVWC